jgi:cobalt-zinc-cadmium efflux system outer membrane protein
MRPFWGALCAVLCWSGSALGAEGSAVLRLSLDDALQRVDDQNPIVQMARRERLVVAAGRVGAGVRMPYNPVASTTLGHRWDSSASNPQSQGFEWAVRVEQPVEIGGQRAARLSEVDRAIQAALARERLARVEARARVRAAYITALVTQAQVEAAKRQEELANRVYESAKARVAAGAASDVETHLAEVERGRVRHDRVEAELSVAESINQVRLLLGIPVTTDLELTTALGEPQVDVAPVPALLEMAMARREELKALAATRSQLDAAIVRLRRELIPTLAFGVDVMQQQPGQTYVGGALAFALPFFQRNQGPIAQARAEIDRTDFEQRWTVAQVQADVALSFRTVQARQEESRLWTERILPSAEANVDLVTQGWRAGKFDLFRVIQVNREAGEARRRQLGVLGLLWHAVIDLDRATGVL